MDNIYSIQLLLFGAINGYIYALKRCIQDNMNNNDKRYELFDKLKHAGYNNEDKNKITGYKYIEKISEYTAAAVCDHTCFPLGYPVYKHLEILQSGFLGLYLNNGLYFKIHWIRKK